MGIPALVLALILPLIMFFSATLVIRAGIQMDSVDDLKLHTLISESFITEILSPLKTLPDLPTPSTILRNGARRVSLPMMTGSSWGSPPRKAKQNICTILISKKLWKMEPCS